MKQQKRFTKRNGITLISLVITIVIMLILAGVAISITVDEDGLFKQAKNATEKWGAKVTEEEDVITNALSYLGITPPSNLPAGWDPSKVAAVVTQESALHEGEEAKVRNVPIPKGYTASQIAEESTISGGLVIYQTDEGQTEVTGTADSAEHITAMETRNQYVWIPVDDINDMVMCKKNNIAQGSYEENGETVTTTICKLVYDVTNDEIICRTHGYDTSIELSNDSSSPNSIDKIGLAGRFLKQTTKALTDEEGNRTGNNLTTLEKMSNQKFVANSTNWNDGSGFREPDLVSEIDKDDITTDDDDSNDYMRIAGITSGKVEDFKKQLNEKFIEMAKSVAKYGGFFISRFEPGYVEREVISKKNQKVLTGVRSIPQNTDINGDGNPDEKPIIEGNMWYGLYNQTLNSTEKTDSVNSHMIWGCQYEQVVRFIGDDATIGHMIINKDMAVTGYEGDKDILNNIYDLEGNNYEWTAEVSGVQYRVTRGCYFGYADRNVFWGAAKKADPYSPNTDSGVHTARPTLYLK